MFVLCSVGVDWVVKKHYLSFPCNPKGVAFGLTGVSLESYDILFTTKARGIDAGCNLCLLALVVST